MGLINYLGNSKVIKRICQLLKVTDVQDEEGHSLVDENGIAVVTGGGSGSSTLADLTDVDVTGASDGDVLSFDGTNWKDKTLATVAASGAYNDLLNKPTALSAFTNDTGFITNSVNNLTNYYLKSETYTKSEVNNLIGQITTISILVVQVLPQTGETNIIYLVPKSASETSNAYDEYIYVSGAWELIGDTTVDLSNYYTKSETDTLLNAKTNETSSFTEAQTRTNIASGDTITTILGKIKKFFTDLKTVAFTGSYDDLSNTPMIPDISTKVSKSGDTMSGTLSMETTDNVAIDFRPNHAGYHTTISHQTGGNEACVFATKNAVTSFIFANGEDSITNHSSNRWQSLTPALQMKNGKVAIGKLIANGTTPTDSLDVAGNTKLEFLNNLPPNTYMGEIGSGNTILNVLQNSAPSGVTLWKSQQADDSPIKGVVSCCLIGKHSTTGIYSYIYLFGQGGTIYCAKTSSSIPSSLTWKNVTPDWITSGKWHYHKDAQDVYHLHYDSGNISINFNGSIGSLKYRNTTYDINFPVTLTDAFSIQVSALCNNDIVGATIHSYTSSGIKLWLWAAGSGTKTIQIHIDVTST